MDHHEIEQCIGDWLQARLEVDLKTILEADSFYEIGLDSFGFIELITEIEKMFSIKFSTDEVLSPNVNRFADITQMAARKLLLTSEA